MTTSSLGHSSGRVSGLPTTVPTVQSPIPGLDTREFALAAWLLVGLVAALFASTLRASLASVLRAVAHWKALSILGAMVVYVLACIAALSAIHLWTGDLISENVSWFFFSAVALLFRAVTGREREDFFRRTVRSVVAVTAIAEFFFSLRTLNLVAELTLQPFVLMLTLTMTVAQARGGKSVATFLQGVLATVVLFLVIYTLSGFVAEPNDFLTRETLLEFLLPVVLTLALVPFIYVVALLSAYGRLFTTLNWKLAADARLRRRAKRVAVRRSHARLSRAQVLASKLPWRLNVSTEPTEIDGTVAAILRTAGR